MLHFVTLNADLQNIVNKIFDNTFIGSAIESELIVEAIFLNDK